MNEELLRQIEERKTQARDRGIFNTAKRIARSLGAGNPGRRDSQGLHVNMVYTSEGLIVTYTAHSDDSHRDRTPYETVDIQYAGETVFRQRGSAMEGYVPGEWEAEMTSLLPAVARAEESESQAKEVAARAADSEKSERLRRAWGLSGADNRSREGDEPRKPGSGGVLDRPAGGATR